MTATPTPTDLPEALPTHEQICDLLLIGNPTDEECRLIRLGYAAALAAHQPNAALADGWMDLRDWPSQDETVTEILAAIHVRQTKPGAGIELSWWEQHVITLDDDGVPVYVGSGESTGWELSDYSHFKLLGAPPTLNAIKGQQP